MAQISSIRPHRALLTNVMVISLMKPNRNGKMHTNYAISPKDWVNIGLGALFGCCLVYLPTHSVLAALLTGLPCGAGGIALAFLLLKRFRPDLNYMDAGNAKITKSAILGAVASMLVTTVVYFIVFPSMPSRLAIVALDMFITVHLIYNYLVNKRRQHKSSDDNHVV